jgi:hypothetical protein
VHDDEDLRRLVVVLAGRLDTDFLTLLAAFRTEALGVTQLITPLFLT